MLEMSAVEFASLIAGIPRAEPTKDAPEQTKRTLTFAAMGLKPVRIGRKLTSENPMPTCAKKQKRTLTAIKETDRCRVHAKARGMGTPGR